jgi:phenylacetic acid degradation operon negative regulatory protein
MASRQMHTFNASYHPQQVVLTLFSDYMLQTGSGIATEALIKLLANFGLSPQAVRSATSRMSRKGLLVSKKLGRRSYYSLTVDGRALLNERVHRLFKRKSDRWNGMWNIVTYSIPEKTREIRDTLRRELTWLGYGPLSEATWVSPYDTTADVLEMAQKFNIKDCVQIFSAKQLGETDPKILANSCWHLDKMQDKYRVFLDVFQDRFNDFQQRLSAGKKVDPSECFVERFHLIREYRKLPFFDRDLPLELLPDNWLRPQAAALFDEYQKLLFKKANEYFDSVFEIHPQLSTGKKRAKK